MVLYTTDGENMTEEEARTKWCPHVRHTDSENDNTCNRAGVIETPMRWNSCIASDCMMWRGYPIQYTKDCKNSTQQIGGYCGLGGKYGN